MAGVPSHKVIPGTSFTVDGFRHPQPWVKAYFLSHAHSDHYTGLNENWSAGPIYCSPVTAALAEHLAGVPAQYLHALQLDTPYQIEGVQVTLIDANHCPGAVQLLFELPDGSKYIHCGDMRYCRQMQDNPHLARFRGANAVFLDTTYCRPRHTFPTQETAVEFVASRIQQLLQEDGQADSQSAGTAADTAANGNAASEQTAEPTIDADAAAGLLASKQSSSSEISLTSEQQEQQPTIEQQQQPQCEVEVEDCCDSQVTAGEQLGFRRLYLISTYVIGKERLLLAVARRTGKRLLVTQKKIEVLRRIGLSESELNSCFTTDPCETPIHVLRWGVLGDTWPYFRPNYTNMEQAIEQTGAQEVVGFVPTGWLHEMNKAARKGTFPSRTKGSCTVWLIPYSEHSSFVELKEYVAWLKPQQVIPTVNVGESGAAGDKHRNSMLQHFRGLLDETSNKAAFLARMASTAATAAANIAVMAATADDASGAPGDTGSKGADPHVEPVQDAADAAGHAVGGDRRVAADGIVDGSDGFWDCADPSLSTVEAINATAAAATAAEVQKPPQLAEAGASTADATGGKPGPAAVTPAADGAQALGAANTGNAESDTSLQLLLAIAGPDSSLSATDAQQLLAAAKGDMNAALNAFLDASHNTSQQDAAAHAAPAAGGSNSDSRKRQQQQKSLSGDSRKGSKKPSKQASAAGQSAITAFFGPRSTATPRKQQQQLIPREPLSPHEVQEGPRGQQQQQQGRSPSPAAAVHDLSGGVTTGAAGPVSVTRVVLPSLKRKSISPTPPLPISKQPLDPLAARVAVVNVISAVVQQNSRVPNNADVASPPAAEAGPLAAATASTNSAAVNEEPGAPATPEGTTSGAASTRSATAAEAPAGPGGERRQQQQGRSSKQSWAAVFPGALTPPAKRRKGSTAASPAAPVSSKTEQALTAAVEHKSKPLDPAASLKPSSSTMPILGASSSSGNSSITKSIRAAPLLPLTRYNPLTDACWPPGEPAPYLALGLTLSAVDATSSRLKIADGLTNLFRSLMLLAPQDVTAAAYLICGKIAPEYTAGCELNVGGGVVSSALCDVCGVSRSQLRDMYAQHGDLGDVAQACRRKQTSLLPPPPLTISGVFNTLHSLAAQAGQGAAGRRQSTVAKLLRCCRDVETKYLVRTLVQNLRVGAGWKSVLGPLAKAALLHRNMMQAAGIMPQIPDQQQQQSVQPAALNPAMTTAAVEYCSISAAKVTKQQLEAAAASAAAAYHTCPNLGIIVDVLMRYGPEGLASRVQLTCGVPVKPMLARPCTSTADALLQLAATAAVAAAGGKRPGRGAAGKKASMQIVPAAAVVGDGVDIEAGYSSDGEADDADDVVMVDHDSTDADALAAAAAAADNHDNAGADAAAAALSSARVLESASPAGLSILAEYKYDGQRAQIHVGPDRQVYIFSRNCEDRTHSFPDVATAISAAAAPEALPLVVDAELAAVDRTDGNRLRAFQELASRPRGSAAAAAGDVAGSSAGRSAAAVALTVNPAASAGQKASSAHQLRQQKQQKIGLTQAAYTGDMQLPQQQHDHQQQQQQQSHESGIDICIFVFDALCIGGVDLMGRSLRERRAALVAALPGAAPGVVQLAEGVEVQVDPAAVAAEGLSTAAEGVTAPAEAVEQPPAAGVCVVEGAEQSVTDCFFKALAAGTEGLMLKLLDGPGAGYQPAKRGLSWIKLKRDYLEGLADSIDLVPIGAWHGQGRKVKWYSPFLLAVYDPASETFQSLCRCMSGFTDEFYAAATARLGARAISGPKPYYETFERPDVWFEPSEVWEIRGADISISPVHRAAAGRLHADRGLGLRFPRYLRIRDDKRPEEASGPDFIVDLYNKQTRRVVNK